MRILVTGGAGYIGSVTVERLVAAGASVVVFDNLSQGHRAAVHPRATFVEGDLANRWEIDAVLKEHCPEAVLHFAAHSNVGESMRRPFEFLEGNVTCGLNLLHSMVEHNVLRFVLSSTASVYNASGEGRLDEQSPIAPGSPYGESKQTLERMLAWLDRLHGLRYTSLRYFNASGASAERGEDHTPELHLIPNVLRAVLAGANGTPLTIFGDDYPTSDGTCVRDYIHVADLADAHILAVQALDNGSRIYNLGNGRGFSVRQVIDAAQRITGESIPFRVGPRRPGDSATVVASSDKIRRELGWEPKISDLDQIVDSAWQWHRRHPAGYGDCQRSSRSREEIGSLAHVAGLSG